MVHMASKSRSRQFVIHVFLYTERINLHFVLVVRTSKSMDANIHLERMYFV